MQKRNEESLEALLVMIDPAPTLPVGTAGLLAFPKSSRPSEPYVYNHRTARTGSPALSAH